MIQLVKRICRGRNRNGSDIGSESADWNSASLATPAVNTPPVAASHLDAGVSASRKRNSPNDESEPVREPRCLPKENIFPPHVQLLVFDVSIPVLLGTDLDAPSILKGWPEHGTANAWIGCSPSVIFPSSDTANGLYLPRFRYGVDTNQPDLLDIIISLVRGPFTSRPHETVDLISACSNDGAALP